MTLLLLFKLSAVIVCVALGAGILARDHGIVANRLIAAFLFCSAWWAACEFVLLQTSDVELSLVVHRWLSYGWMPLGVLCMHGSLTFSSMTDHPVVRVLPWFYAALAVSLPFAAGTGAVIADIEPVTFGVWQPTYGPLFPFVYLLVALPIVSTLVSWSRVMRLPGREGRHELAGVVFFGVACALATGTITAVLVPLAGGNSIGITTNLISVVGLATAWTLRRHGHSLISPEAFAREIFDTLEDGVVVLSHDGRIRDANRAFGRLVGAGHASLVGRSVIDWVPNFPPKADALEAPTLIDHETRDGESVPVVISPPVRLVAGPRFPMSAYLFRDRREVVSLQRQIAVAGRLAAVGDLSKSISESIHGPASLTRVELEKLATEWAGMRDWLETAGQLDSCREATDEGLELIDECLEGIDRVTAIVSQVGSFSAETRKADEFSRCRLSEIVDSALRIARVQASPGVDIESRLDPEIEVLCNRTELERVVTNLLVNSFHALESRPTGAAHLAVAVGAQGSRALIHVEDDGCGIAPDALDRVFDPFFTTKPVGKGTGLGLAISYHIVKKHGGEIRVSSIEDRGTGVAVELPRFFDRAD